ncbi:diaminopimelate epimerase [Candidatus Hydrogenedentota bacterium]
MRFTKMHGLGNDYLFLNCFEENVPDDPGPLAIAMSNRHIGVGADGIILVLPSKLADFRMRMFNSDGSEAEMCGNGLRCFSKYVFEKGFTDKKEFQVETLAGIRDVQLRIRSRKVSRVKLCMGPAHFLRGDIPMTGPADHEVIDEELEVCGHTFKINCASVGNPHTVIFVSNVADIPLEEYGPVIENHKLFPRRTNVEFVEVRTRNKMIMRVWERGSGVTLACGTGATAVSAIAMRNGLCADTVKIHLEMGALTITKGENGLMYLEGPAEEIFEGEWLGAV